ncbi:MAG TPA: tubulin-like doman-containing protein [Thermoanaerobaculia bacterium]|nr:tubulin-like doman-containing protein [Thermoanaerobaculia bacterium]
MLTKPSAISPILFVGLGGCGCRMVARVAKHLKRRTDFVERFKKLVKFAFVDTNVNDLESYRDHADEAFLISDFEKEQYSNLASGKLFLEADPYFTQWVPPNYRFRAGDTAGAGQIRLESRLGVYYQMKHKGFVPRFRRLLEELKSHELGQRRLDSSEVRVVMCFSVAGGTGSGCHLPVAYMLRDQTSELGSPLMVGVAVLPAVFEDKTGVNRDGTFANSYAALKEIEHFMRLGAPESQFFPEGGLAFHYDPSDESKKSVRERPFEFLYVIDKPESFSVPEPIDAAADGLYLQMFSPLFGAQVSDYDNFTQHQRFLVPHDFEGKGIPGFTTFYGSYGAAVLLVPSPGLIDYCSQAAALSLMRASFLGAIPGDTIFAPLRMNSEEFNQATLSDEKNQRPIAVKDFAKKTQLQQATLRDRLFTKRVRLLASCELAAQVDGRFLGIFRHGHRVGEVPSGTLGDVEFKGDRVELDEENRAKARMVYSIAAIVLPAICSDRPEERPGLLEHAEQAIREYAERNRMAPAEGLRLVDLKNRATGWMQDYQNIGMGVLMEGYVDGTVQFPGMDSMVELRFLNEEAGQVDLAAKRYAILSILDRIRKDRPSPPLRTDFEISSDRGSTKPLKRDDQIPIIETLERQAIQRAMEAIERIFNEKQSELRSRWQRLAEALRTFDQGFESIERDRVRRLDRLRTEGDPSANEYVLDAEALQIENGRRMWDFYYEDRIADRPELSLENADVQRVLSDSITHLSLGTHSLDVGKLDEIYSALYQHAKSFLEPHIAGDPHSPDRENRDGLILSEAIDLEVVYRALYLSNAPQVDRDGHRAIREIVQQYRAYPAEQRVQLDDPKHQEYLRDKIRRVVKEKASLLCSYDESRDRQGGVRPDLVALAEIAPKLRDTWIGQAIRGAEIPNLNLLEEGWDDPKSIVFYRAILNVPLYVFGRMDDMKHEYYRFKNLARRSKALHIDRNWEETLPDLDPVSAQSDSRNRLVRNQIINFAALLVRSDLGGVARSYVVRRQGRYLLTDPNQDNGAGGEDGLVVLGTTMAEAIEALPEVLSAEKVKYLRYQKMLQGVREGLSPQLVAELVLLPVSWRRNAEELRRIYQSRPESLEHELLKDYETSYRGLQAALEDLHEELRRKQVEQKTLGEEGSGAGEGLDPKDGESNLAASIAILDEFCRQWHRMEQPDENSQIPEVFKKLFTPLREGELNDHLKRLRGAFGI